MSNLKKKIVYSLQIHIELQQRGFVPLLEMKNPQNQKYNCWVYAETPEFLIAFDEILRGCRN